MDMSGHGITVYVMTRLQFRARRISGIVIYRFAAISGVNQVGNGDGLGMLMLSMMLLCMNFLVLLEVLGSLERLLTDLKCNEHGRYRRGVYGTHIAQMGFERCMHCKWVIRTQSSYMQGRAS